MTISAINLGNTFTNTNGSTVLSGLSSGLNTQSVINSIVSAQSSQIAPLQDKITVNNSQASALTTLQQLLTSLQSAASPLSNPQSPDSTNNLWAVTTSNITSNTSQAASNYLTASVASGTASGNYTISNISQLATATTQQTGTFTVASASSGSVVAATSTAGEFTAGTITFSGGATVTLTAGETLNQVATAFNAVTTTSGSVTGTGIGASVLQTAPGVYTMVFTSATTGAASLFDLTNTAKTTISSGTSLLGNVSLQTMSASNEGQNASFEFNGVTITRPTNTISDLVSGVTLNLLQNTTTQAGASFTLQIAPDTASIMQGISNFATAYNNFLGFYATQTQLNSTGTPASAAILYSDTALQDIYNQVTTEAASIVQGISKNSPNQFSDIGISFADTPATSTTPPVSNTLSIDSTTLQNELTSNFSAVENVFGYNFTSSSPNLVLFQSSNNQTVSNFTVNVDESGPTYTATYTDATGATQNIALTATSAGSGSVLLTAPSSSALGGLELIYGGDGTDSPITISTTQGIADQINNLITMAITPNTGLIATDQAAISTKNTTLQTQITTITTQITTTRQQLLSKFAALESAITSANSALNYLNAQQLASSSG